MSLNFSEILYQLREIYRAHELAKKLKVSTSTINRWAREDNAPTHFHQRRILALHAQHFTT